MHSWSRTRNGVAIINCSDRGSRAKSLSNNDNSTIDVCSCVYSFGNIWSLHNCSMHALPRRSIGWRGGKGWFEIRAIYVVCTYVHTESRVQRKPPWGSCMDIFRQRIFNPLPSARRRIRGLFLAGIQHR